MSPIRVLDVTHFAPYDDPAGVILELVTSAAESIHIDIYGLTWGPLIDALIAAHGRGVAVNIVADHSQAQGHAERPALQRLVDAGIAVLVGTSSRGGIDHSKYLVIDGALGVADEASCVGFGSFNFSESARAQDNTFTVRNDAGYVAAFLANWTRVYDDAAGRHPDWQVSASAAVPSPAAQGAGDPSSPAPVAS